MSVISYQDRDNVITNRVTLASGLCAVRSRPAAQLELISMGGLPCPLEEIMDHLKVDDPEDDETIVEIMARAAAAFIARRTAYVVAPTQYRIMLDDAFDHIVIERGPLRGEPVIEIQTDRGVWAPVSTSDYWSTPSDRAFTIRGVDGSGSWARPWQSEGCYRVMFEAGYDAAEESGGYGLEIDPGLKMIFFLITGHYYKNREMLGLGSSKIGLDAVDVKGAEALLGAYRQIW